MKLSSLRRDVLTYTLEDLIVKVEQDGSVRSARLAESANFAFSPKKAASATTRLSDAEKAILKSLGLSIKTIKAIQTGGQMDG